MAAFIRRYDELPATDAELLKIEGVVIVDGKTTPQVRGVGTGTVLCVGEFEDGAFCADAGPVEVFGSDDLLRRFGSFGFTYDGIAGQHPCCRTRSADSAIVGEPWNGNGFIQLKGGRFARLFLARVDTSVGSVQLTRLAAISGNANASFDLEPGWTIKIKLDGGSAVTATFDAAAATKDSATGSYPWAPAGGESITFKIDGTTYTATFLATDTTQSLTISRMNAAAGFTAFADEGSSVTSITGRIRGTGGSVQIVSVSGASVTTATGFSAGAAVAGTGDVANIDAVTDAELNTVIAADVSGTGVDRDYNGNIRVFATSATTIEIDATSTGAAAMGWITGVEADAGAGVAGSIPAGTRVQASGSGQLFVTMQSVSVLAASAGPYEVKVRHATDDGTGTAESAGDIDTLYAPVQLGAFAVTNDLPSTDALSEAQIDARYVAAIEKTRGVTKSRQINLAFSARQSNAVRNAARTNAIDASSKGCFGRTWFIRPPFGTDRETARGSAQPGVGAYRHERVRYAYPGIQKYIPEIAALGTDGGTGFTADGLVNAGFDMAWASLCSQLNPEENVGQATALLDFVLGIESGNTDVSDLQQEDYEAFKRAGIGAVRIDDGEVTLQSDVTSVDPSLYPNLAPGNVRRFKDFYQDSTAVFTGPFVKKLATKERRALLIARYNQFLTTLADRGAIVREQSKVFGDAKVAGNTPESLSKNLFLTKHFVRMTSVLEVIVLSTLIGNDVTIQEA